MDNDAIARLEQRVTALVAELQRQRERNQALDTENESLRSRLDQARRRLDALLESTAEEG